MVFFVPSAGWFELVGKLAFIGRCFPDNYSLALEIQRIAS
ncbi:hypothetical protein P781_15750, partial [Vibrio mimicus CAIM 1883]